MKSEWLRTTIDKMIDDYDQYINKNNSASALRFRNSAIQVIKMLKEDRKQIQILRYLRDDYLIRYNYDFEKRKQKVLSGMPLVSKETTLQRFKLSEKAQNHKDKASKKRDLSIKKNDDSQSYDIF